MHHLNRLNVPPLPQEEHKPPYIEIISTSVNHTWIYIFFFTVCIGNGCNKRGCLISPCICLEYWLCIPPGKYALYVSSVCAVYVFLREVVFV